MPIEPSSPDQRLHEVIAAFLLAVEKGEAPDAEQLIQQHPDLAASLREFFADHERLRQVAPPRPAAASKGTETLPFADGAATPAGTRVRYFGDYELIEEIARGGMGVVYKARQVSLNRVVALKMILAGQLADEVQVRRFYAEAQTAAGLQHPNIVAIHQGGGHNDQHYF